MLMETVNCRYSARFFSALAVGFFPGVKVEIWRLDEVEKV